MPITEAFSLTISFSSLIIMILALSHTFTQKKVNHP